jgi:hypothetical protein
MTDVLEIRMQSRPAEGEPCRFCVDGICDGYHGLPIFNGDVVSNDWRGDWGGVPCCPDCYQRHADGRMRTFDHLYQHLMDGFVAGGGI